MTTFRLPAAVLAAGLTLAQAAPSGHRRRRPSRRSEPSASTPRRWTPAVKPGDDFFRYVNGKWLRPLTIPGRQAPRYGIVRRAARPGRRPTSAHWSTSCGRTPALAGSVRQKVADLYASWMDEARIEARGLEPLRPTWRQIDAATDQDRSGPPDGPTRLLGAVRARHHRRSGRPDALRRDHRPGGPWHAGARLLPVAGREVRRLSRRLPRPMSRALRAARRRTPAEQRASRSSRSKPSWPSAIGRRSGAAT